MPACRGARNQNAAFGPERPREPAALLRIRPSPAMADASDARRCTRRAWVGPSGAQSGIPPAKPPATSLPTMAVCTVRTIVLVSSDTTTYIHSRPWVPRYCLLGRLFLRLRICCLLRPQTSFSSQESYLLHCIRARAWRSRSLPRRGIGRVPERDREVHTRILACRHTTPSKPSSPRLAVALSFFSELNGSSHCEFGLPSIDLHPPYLVPSMYYVYVHTRSRDPDMGPLAPPIITQNGPSVLSDYAVMRSRRLHRPSLPSNHQGHA